MKNINDDELRFVLSHYRRGRLDTRRAWRRFQEARGMRPASRLRRIAMAASVAVAVGIAVAAGMIGYRHYFLPQKAKPAVVPADSAVTVYERNEADTTCVFRYDNTPINSVLGELSRHYRVSLAASDTTKSVSGEIEAASVDDAIGILEATMDIRITKKP